VETAERIRSVLTTPFEINQRTIFASASIGVAFSSKGCIGPDKLLRNADLALYRAAFIPVAEETGTIVPIGRHVLNMACRQVREWQRRYPWVLSLVVGVNLSARRWAGP
jgi:predicted signal transduction protein with EAL and GGDEF domain